MKSIYRTLKIMLLLIVIISPLDVIPDWVPIFGGMDDLVASLWILYYLYEEKIETLTSTHPTKGKGLVISVKIIMYTLSIAIPITGSDLDYKITNIKNYEVQLNTVDCSIAIR